MFVICEPTLGAEPNDDRIGTILSYMVRMRDDMKLLNQKVDGVQTEVKDVARIEELTSEHLLKLENRVTDVITKQGKMENQVAAVKNQVAAVKNQVSVVQSEISAVDGKVEKVDRDVHFGWTSIGEGVDKTYDEDHYYKDGATLGECIEYCQKHREDNGREWNGLIFLPTAGRCGCRKNSRGIDTEGWSEWVLYRVA